MSQYLYTSITLDPSIREAVYLAGVELQQVKVLPRDETILEQLQKETEALRARYPAPAAARERFEPARWMYRTLGVDPTRTRPSSEALVRRILQGKELFQINSVVDAFNLLSIRFALPVGLYDTEYVVPPVIVRKGKAGEGYPGIGKEYVNLEGRLCLVDQEGPFGNPSSDSARTRIRPETTGVLAVFFVPAVLEPQRARQVLNECSGFVERYLHPACFASFMLHA